MTARTRSPLTLALLAAAAVTMLSAAFALASTGVYYDDDLAHYMIARFAWRHPELFLNTWGRPSFTILYAPAAALGFVPARLFSALLAGATALAAAHLAQLHGVQRGWLAALLTGAQPELLRQGFSTLTELVFALLLALGLIAARRERWVWLALAAGWLPLARYESLPLVAIFGVLLLLKGQWRLLPLLALPLLAQNSFYALREGNPALLLFPLDQALGVRANAPSFDYGTGDPLYYLHRAPLAFGPAIFALACLGMARVRPGLLLLSVLTMLAVLSLTYWLLPGAGVAGYIRHLAMVAPAVGVLAAIGLERIAAPLAQARAPGWLVPLLGVGLALWLGLRNMYAGALVAAAGAALPAVPRVARSAAGGGGDHPRTRRARCGHGGPAGAPVPARRGAADRHRSRSVAGGEPLWRPLHARLAHLAAVRGRARPLRSGTLSRHHPGRGGGGASRHGDRLGLALLAPPGLEYTAGLAPGSTALPAAQGVGAAHVSALHLREDRTIGQTLPCVSR